MPQRICFTLLQTLPIKQQKLILARLDKLNQQEEDLKAEMELKNKIDVRVDKNKIF